MRLLRLKPLALAMANLDHIHAVSLPLSFVSAHALREASAPLPAAEPPITPAPPETKGPSHD